MPPATSSEAGRAALEAALRAAEGLEFRTFLCGCRSPAEGPEPGADAFRRAANRSLGMAPEEAWRGERVVDFRRPDVRFTLRLPAGTVDASVSPLFVYGRYLKHSRALAQTPYHCPRCRGQGCNACGRTGRLLPGSIAEHLVPLLVEAAGAEDGSFKGCGREDADVRMLGRGRPFVAALKRPRRRLLGIAAIAARTGQAAAGAVEFPVLHAVASAEGERVPATHPPKRYRARVEVEGGARPGDDARLARTRTPTSWWAARRCPSTSTRSMRSTPSG